MCYLYKNSPKELREFKEFRTIFEKTMQKSAKSMRTCWIAHTVRAMETILVNYVIFMAHVDSVSQTDSQVLKQAEIEDLVKKWLQGKYTMHLKKRSLGGVL